MLRRKEKRKQKKIELRAKLKVIRKAKQLSGTKHMSAPNFKKDSDEVLVEKFMSIHPEKTEQQLQEYVRLQKLVASKRR